MREEILNNLNTIASELPIWVVIFLCVFFVVLTYAVVISIRNYIRLVFTPTTSVAALSPNEKVEVKGKIVSFDGTTFTAPFDDKKVCFLKINCSIEERILAYNDEGKSVRQEEKRSYRDYQKGNDLFYLQDKTGKVLIAHHTFLNKNHQHETFAFKPQKVPQAFKELFPDIADYRSDAPHKFLFECHYLEVNDNVLVTGQVVQASIDDRPSLAIFGGLGKPTELQETILTQQEARNFVGSIDNVVLHISATSSQLSNTSYIEFGTEMKIIARKTVNLVLLLLFEVIFGGVVWGIVRAVV